jgi:ribosome-binding factor A
MRSKRSPARSEGGGEPSPRRLKVGEELRHALADVLAHGDLRDPALHGRSITVSEVDVSPDLKRATAYVMPLGGGEVAAVLEGLRRAGPYLRRELARRVRLRFAPELAFEADAGFLRAERISRILDEEEPADDGT